MHMVIPFGVNAEIDTEDDGRQNAIGWLCFNRRFRGQQLLTLHEGKPLGIIAPGLQGHHGQFLAILAQARLRRDYPLHVAGREFTVQDLLENEERTCRSGMELTFKLIAVAHYRATDHTWHNEAGQTWNLPRLVREEIAAPIQGAACGGTHRLMGLARAVRKREQEGKPLDGEFGRARKYLNDYHRYAFQLQNADGSFSTKWLEYREARPELDRRVQTTGHILEWLAYSLSDEELRQADTLRAVRYLTDVLWDHRDRTWENGPLGHALSGLQIFQRRVSPFTSEKPSSNAATEAREDIPPARAPGANQAAAAGPILDWIERSILIHHQELPRRDERLSGGGRLSPNLLPPRRSPIDRRQMAGRGHDQGPLLFPAQPIRK